MELVVRVLGGVVESWRARGRDREVWGSFLGGGEGIEVVMGVDLVGGEIADVDVSCS